MAGNDHERLTDEELAEEARSWTSGEQTLEGWINVNPGRNQVDDNIMKERALLFLDRRIGELETTTVNHTAMADRAVSYGERRRVEAGTKERQEKNQQELEAMQWVRGKLLEL